MYLKRLAFTATAIGISALTLQQAHANDDPLPVTVIPLGNITIPIEYDVKAELVSLNDSPVSSELSAKVINVNVNIGDVVNKGDTLATLDCRDFNVAVRKAKAGIYSVRARIKAAEARAGASESRVHAAESRVNAARARFTASEAQVKAANSRLDATDSRIKARVASMQSTQSRIKTAETRVKAAQAQADAAHARIPSAEAQLRLSRTELNRNRQLHKEQLIATSVVDQAQSSFDSAQSSLSSSQSDAAAAKVGIYTAQADVDTAKADYRASQAEVDASNADLATSKADVEINQANTQISRTEVDTAKTDVQTAQAEWKAAKADAIATKTELETAKANLESAEISVERCKITAPFTGQITAKQLQLGQLATPGVTAFQILQTSQLEVSAKLSTFELMDQAQSENTRFIANGKTVTVKRRATLAQVDNTTGTQEVRFKTTEAHPFPVGKTGRLQWQGKLPAVPPEWLMRRDGKLGLMLAVGNKAEFHTIENAKEGQAAVVTLPSDTLLINDNRLRARPGQSIKRIEHNRTDNKGS